MVRLRRSPQWPALRPLLLPSLVLGAALAVITPQRALAQPAQPQLLYSLQTFCSLNGTKAVPCQVDAVNDGDATIYRHTIGRETRIVRITDKPTVRMELWDDTARSWRSARSASALFSLNVLCFDGTSLCVVNPNYLNSVREDRGDALVGRDLLEVTFGKDGRINAYCYDEGCPEGGALRRLATRPDQAAK